MFHFFVFPVLLTISVWLDPPPTPLSDIPDIPNIPLVLSLPNGHNFPDIPHLPDIASTVPDIDDMCLAITSYWVWDANGDMLAGWGGQCNEDCSITGAGYTLPARAEDYIENYAACIFDWTSLIGYPTTLVSIPGYGDYKCVDNFGAPNYQQPFYHDYYEQWVIPIDLLSPFAHNLVCDWDKDWTNP